MDKLLYIAPVIVDLNKLNGVSKKILNHYKVFCKYYNASMISYGPDCLYYFHDDIVETIALGTTNRRIKLYSFVKFNLGPKQYNSVYIRYHLSDFLFLNVLHTLRKNNSKIVIEIPTYPYKNELLKWKGGVLRYLVDVTSRCFLKNFVGHIVTYSEDKTIFGIKTIKTINGIIYENVIPVKKNFTSESDINLISVSQTMHCHGYDRLIEGLKNYYNNGGIVNILYHLVGEGEEIEKYIDLVKQYNLDKHVRFYGFKTGEELDKIYDKAEIAINSLGIHRIGLKSESTIKSKEYAAKGLPMVSSYEIDAFSIEDNKKYVHLISCDDTPLDINSLIEFYKRIYHRGFSQITNEIRIASKRRCDMEITLKGVMDYFNTVVEFEKV